MKKALISGPTGQDGSYLAELLLSKGYEVHGIIRRASSINTQRIDHIFDSESKKYLHYGDLQNGIDSLLHAIKPDEVYNLGAMSHVKISFDIPVYTGDVTGLAVTRILEGIRQICPKAKFYQASSSEMFGTTPPPQGLDKPFMPVSPYGCAKLYGYHMTRTYRAGYGMFACNGVLFNHESPRRGHNFVTKKIVRRAVQIWKGDADKIVLGNLEAKRDWGHAKDYMEAVFKIMQYKEARDWIVSSGTSATIRDFAERVFKRLDMKFDKYLVESKDYYRPNEVPWLLGDSKETRELLQWEPKYTLETIIEEMLHDEIQNYSQI